MSRADRHTLYVGDCLEVMPSMEPNSVDAVVTDPPYGLAFMSKAWDRAVPGPEFFAEMLRVAKPGAHLFAFGGTRLYHRMTCAIEDAGWLVRDCLMWLYGSGFPKSLDVSKAIDKAAGAERDVIGPGKWNHLKGDNGRQADCLIRPEGKHVETAAVTDLARTFEGYGTALKPAWEPIVLAMKPLDGTFAANAEKWGVAGLNIDGGRYGGAPSPSVAMRATRKRPQRVSPALSTFVTTSRNWTEPRPGEQLGRWPTNLALDESAANLLGDCSRFFFTAKAGAEERTDGNTHPTVKPNDLMRWLVRLARPPGGGVILDPFMGSGSTGVACIAEGSRFVGIERDEVYAEIARKRIERAYRTGGEVVGVDESGVAIVQRGLFG